MIGLIAQEVEAINPAFVDNCNSDLKSLDKDQILWATIQELQKLRAEVDTLKQNLTT